MPYVATVKFRAGDAPIMAQDDDGFLVEASAEKLMGRIILLTKSLPDCYSIKIQWEDDEGEYLH